MDHPLRSSENSKLRGRVVHLLKNGFSIARQSNIIFVCGGKKPSDMRRQFQQKFDCLLPGYEFFEPEFAMENYFSFGDIEPFDIADFELLVGELSLAIVLFPEAPGSYAELGYFSTQDDLSSKTVLSLDSNHQRSGSFISLGPAKKISKSSIFGLPIQMDYKKPDFELVSTRILEHAQLRERRQKFKPNTFSGLTSFELFALIHELVAILVIATGEDIISLFRSMFKSKVSPSKIKKIISILLGSKRLQEIGNFGHLAVYENKTRALTQLVGVKTELAEVTVEISALLYTHDAEFSEILKELNEC